MGFGWVRCDCVARIVLAELSEVFEDLFTYDARHMCLCHVVGEVSLRCVAEVAKSMFVDGRVCALNVTV